MKKGINVKEIVNFDLIEFRNSLAFADLANNLGEAMQRNGMMTEYDTLIEFDCNWKGRWSE